MPKLPQIPSNSEIPVRSDTSEFVRMLLASALFATPACTPTFTFTAEPSTPKVATTPTVVIHAVKPAEPQEPRAYTKPKSKSKAVDGCAKNTEVTPDVERQDTDERLASAKNPGLALSDFYKDSFNAKLYAFSHEFAIHGSQELYLGLLECRPGYGGTSYLNHPDKLQVLQQMRSYYLSQYHSSKTAPAILDAINARIAGLL